MTLPLFDAASFGTGNDGSDATITVSHPGGSGTNRAALVAVCWSERDGVGARISGVTYDGVAMSSLGVFVTQATGNVQVFALKAPNTGTKNVVVSVNPLNAISDPIVVGVVTYTNVDQTTGWNGYATDHQVTAGPVQRSMVSQIGDLVVAIAALTESSSALTASNVTDRVNQTVTVNGNPIRMAIGEIAGAASVTPAWTVGGAAHWVAIGVNLIGASAAGTAAVAGTGASGAVGNDIRAGAKTFVLTLTGDTLNTFDDTIRTAIRAGIVAASSPTWGWNNLLATIIPLANIVRTSSTVCTITLAATPGYQIDANETLTITIPSTAVALAAAIVATPTVTISKTSTDLSPVDDYTMTGTATRVRP